MKETTIFIADDRTKANSYISTFLLFIKKLCPSWGLLIFFKNFFVSAVRFRPSAFGKVLLVLPLARHFYTLYFSFSVSPYSFLGRLFFVKEKER
nr:MAG TPA: hypothetical protein [Caudoviricetes sp.]